MSELADFFPSLLLLAGLLLAALAAAFLAGRLGLPGPAGFLAAGIAAGLLGISPTEGLSPQTLERVGVVALYAILFQGGLSTGYAAWKSSAGPILALGLPGTIATAAGLALAARLLGLDWPLAVLVGVALAPTDPAAVYAVLRGREATRARTILEGESGFNDPAGISLMVVAVLAVASGATSVADGAGRFCAELGIGLAGGLVGAAALAALLRTTPRLEEGFQSVAILAGAVLVGAATASVHGSGFLAVYVTGLLLSDRWARQDGRHHAVPEALAAVSEPVLFGLLAVAFAPLVTGADLARGLALTIATAFIVRPAVAAVALLGSGLRREERVLVSWGGLKGAVPLLLAAFPALEGIDGAETVQATVLVATAASIVVQGATLGWVSRRTSRSGHPGPPPASDANGEERARV